MKKLLTILAVVSMLSTGAIGAPMVYEGFNYGEGTITAANGGIGWGGPWARSAGSATAVAQIPYGSLPTTGETALMSIESGDYSRSLATPFAPSVDGTEVWFSALVGWDGGSGGSFQGNIKFFLQDDTGSKIMSFEKTGSTPSSWAWKIKYLGDTGGETTSVTIGENSLHLLVAKIVLDDDGADSVAWWINPDPSGVAPVNAEASGSQTYAADITNVGGITLDSSGLDDPVNASAVIDEIRFDQSFAGIVPEPTTMGLMGLGLIGLLRRRRK